MPGAGRRQWVPKKLGIIVGMHIDESRGDDQTFGVNDLCRRAVNFTHRGNAALCNRHISIIAGLA